MRYLQQWLLSLRPSVALLIIETLVYSLLDMHIFFNTHAFVFVHPLYQIIRYLKEQIRSFEELGLIEFGYD